MSVYTSEQQREEFPELTVACLPAFIGASSGNIPKAVLRTTPLALAVTSDEPLSNTAQFAADVLAAVAVDEVSPPTVSNTQFAADNGAPAPRAFTMEDGGQSQGACVTSARAAFILANLSDEHDEVASQPINGRTTGRYARQHTGCIPACAC